MLSWLEEYSSKEVRNCSGIDASQKELKEVRARMVFERIRVLALEVLDPFFKHKDEAHCHHPEPGNIACSCVNTNFHES